MSANAIPQPMFLGLGVTELVIILLIVLLIFGAPAIPKLAKAISSAAKEIRSAGSADKDAPIDKKDGKD